MPTFIISVLGTKKLHSLNVIQVRLVNIDLCKYRIRHWTGLQIKVLAEKMLAIQIHARIYDFELGDGS